MLRYTSTYISCLVLFEVFFRNSRISFCRWFHSYGFLEVPLTACEFPRTHGVILWKQGHTDYVRSTGVPLSTLMKRSVNFLTAVTLLKKTLVTQSYLCTSCLEKSFHLLQVTQVLHKQTYDCTEYRYKQCLFKSVILPLA
jgi:hypothetical protein